MAICATVVTGIRVGSNPIKDVNGVTVTTVLSPDLVSDPTTCQYVLVSGQNYKDLVGSVGSFDYVTAAAIFSFFFSFVVGCWVVARNIGLISAAIRRW